MQIEQNKRFGVKEIYSKKNEYAFNEIVKKYFAEPVKSQTILVGA